MGTKKASIPSDLKEENRRSVLRAFRQGGIMSALEVAEKTGISRLTVKKSIEYYISLNVLQSCGKGDSGVIGGKRPEIFALNKDVLFLCVHLHHHEIAMAITNFSFERLAVWSSGYMHIENMDMMWNRIREGIQNLRMQQPDGKISMVTFSVPLGHTVEGRMMVATPFPYWPRSDYGRSLKEPFREYVPEAKDIFVISDGAAAGNALMARNPKKYGKGTVISFYCATGIGGCMLHNGKSVFLLKNQDGPSGAFGHISVQPDDPEPCSCGSHGCLEVVAGRKRMRQRVTARQKEYEESILASIPVEELSFEQLFEGSRKGDLLCQRESRHFADLFANVIRNFVLISNPRYIIFQGDYGRADEVFRQELVNVVNNFKYLDLYHEIDFIYDENDLREEETLGATYMMVDEYLRNPEEYAI